ncbi:MAG: hypothetical protein M3140_12380 [Actinomycetota bacterium]|nr:hypothetical protein [Actinomycetota bacterium]
MIAGAAVVGRVVRVSTSSATVLLAADPQSGIGARDQGSGEIGTVRGAGTAGFTYTPLDAAARPRRGATLVTGPAGSTTYVPGLTIGTVTSIGTDPSGLAVARVVPAAKASTLDVVGVIRLGGQSRPRPAIIPRPASVPGAQARPR